MEDQFDAVLYLGRFRRSGSLARSPWPCAAPAFPERVRRANLQRPGLGDRIRAQCVSD